MFEMSPYHRKVAAADFLLQEWRGQSFSWAERRHCARVLLEHVRRLGHRPLIGKAGGFSTPLGARRALQRLGAQTIGDLLDLHGFPRITPASADAGDAVELPAEDPLGCVTIAMGNGRVGGWHPDAEGYLVLQPVEYTGRAWRLDPR